MDDSVGQGRDAEAIGGRQLPGGTPRARGVERLRMPRYRGRHRKPATGNTAMAKTALAGAVVSAPLVTAGQAQAASDEVWDRVAECESGGDWSIDTGNGYEGGLQFAPSTWEGFGGTKFASSAADASRAEQIAVAEKVLAKQGWGAWPVCSRKADARDAEATPRVITVSDSERKTADTEKADAETAAQSKAAQSKAAQSKAAQSKAAAEKATEAAQEKEAREQAAEEQAAEEQAELAESLTRPADSPTEALPIQLPAEGASQVAPDQPPPTGTSTYLVQPGDSLSTIAAAQGVDGGWRELYEANRGQISDPDLIRPGQQLTMVG